MSMHFTPRSYFPGMGEAVAKRTVNRRIFTKNQRDALPSVLKLNPNDPKFAEWHNAATLSEWPVEISDKAKFMKTAPELRTEDWADVSLRVARGNVSLTPDAATSTEEFQKMHRHLARASLLMSGRHLQHGDGNQKNRNQEVFTNCSTAAFSFILYKLLLNGSGVGRAYDDALMVVNWAQGAETRVVISRDYADRSKFQPEWDAAAGAMVDKPMIPDSVNSLEEELALIKASGDTREVIVHKVGDSRGGWAKAIEMMERLAYQKRSDAILILDFSDVRPHGSPIRGMQNRPSSGPGPMMKCVMDIDNVRLMTDLDAWELTMHVDHHLASCVLVGGARRAARMATKRWDDPNVFGFISFKRRNNFWSSNNSVTIDEEFRELCNATARLFRAASHCVTDTTFLDALLRDGKVTERQAHAWRVLHAIADAAYFDKSGEPGIINQDKLQRDDAGIEAYVDGLFIKSKEYEPDADTLPLLQEVARVVAGLSYSMITNPCGEIALLMLGAYCVIADVVPFHAESDDDAEEAFLVAVRALMRVNTMDCLYGREVKRTNRIGVGITGFHEWAYARFGFTWHDIVNEKKSKPMWMMLSKWRRAITNEAARYAKVLGVAVPHTDTTFKPAGTTSKLFGLSEGAHLPTMRWFMRWVQFRNDDPLVAEYAAKGYPTRALKTYHNTTVVGFPTAPTICELGSGDWVVTASEATPAEQYEFLRLLEKYWLRGVDEDGEPLAKDRGNQISYTLKYDPLVVDFRSFMETLIEGQFSIRCCSVMPMVDTTRYEYQPEEPVTREVFDAIVAKINAAGVEEDVDFAHIDCGAGACPIDFNKDAA